MHPFRLLVDMRFQVYFTPLTGVLFTFPSRYLFTIDLKKYLALPVSTGGFTQAIHVSSYSRTTAIELLRFRVRGYYPLGLLFPEDSSNSAIFYSTCELPTTNRQQTTKMHLHPVGSWKLGVGSCIAAALQPPFTRRTLRCDSC